MTLLIEELNADDSNLILESQEGGKDLYLNGIFMQADIRNGNKRVYPLHEMQKAVVQATEKIKLTNGIPGELNHPKSMDINLDRVSHLITEMKIVGKNVIGKAKIIDTPMGIIARKLIENDLRLGVSSRCTGRLDHDNVVSNLKFFTVDIVGNPSAKEAVPVSIYEALEMDQHGVETIKLAHELQYDKRAQEYLAKEIKKFLSNSIFN